MTQEPDEVIRFHSTSGRITSILAVIGALVIVALAVLDWDGVPHPTAPAAALFGALCWASTLRPRISVTRDELVLRTMVQDIVLPLAAIEELSVRQMLVVNVGDKRYASTALGQSWRRTAAGERRRSRPSSGSAATEVTYDDYAEEVIRTRMERARAAAGVKLLSGEQRALATGVRRELAWLPIALIGASIVAFVVSLLF